jgi:hypothetical protein
MRTGNLVSLGMNGARCMAVRAKVEYFLNALNCSFGTIVKLHFILPRAIAIVQFLFYELVKFMN